MTTNNSNTDKSFRVKMACQTCGGSNVMLDAWAVWDEENQLWELSNTYDDAHCDDCDGQTNIIEVAL